MPGPARLLIAAHGTRSSAGASTTTGLVAAVAAAAPELVIDLCFLDVASPRLAEVLDSDRQPTVVLPLLLSAGYHVRTDIPAITAGRPGVRVARHLGPDPLIIGALADRLAEIARADASADASAPTTVLSGVGSSHAEAQAEFTSAGRQLAERLGHPVHVLTAAADLRPALAALPAPVQIAPYLLAPGDFLDALHRAADGIAAVAGPIGVHPALVELILARYTQACD